MFTVLLPPYDEKFEPRPDVRSRARVALAYQGKRKCRPLMYSISSDNQLNKERIQTYEILADFLNLSDSFYFTSGILLSIIDTWARSERVRPTFSHKSNFGADFGRRDFSEPGQGGSGIDGYW